MFFTAVWLAVNVAQAETTEEYFSRSDADRAALVKAIKAELFAVDKEIKTVESKTFTKQADKYEDLNALRSKQGVILIRLEKVEDEKVPHYAKMPLKPEVGNIGVIFGEVSAYEFARDGVLLEWQVGQPDKRENSATPHPSIRFLLREMKGWKVGSTKRLVQRPYRITGASARDGKQVFHIEPVLPSELKRQDAR